MTLEKASAFWISAPKQGELLDTRFERQDGDVLVKALFSGISRGTERLVFHGQVPPSEHETMRAPFQEGAFTFPVKYGYACVGEVQDGQRAGELVFALFPHQERFAVPDNAAISLPLGVPPERAVLAANMETALNILWDAQVNPGDRVAVVGCGVVGALVGYLAAQVPGTEVSLVDVDTGRSKLAYELGCTFSTPDQTADDADIVVHTSATDEGLATSIERAGLEAKIVEASWYGARSTQAPLGGAFHQRRLKIISSQVGRIPTHQAARWDFARRMTKALCLLNDDRLDSLISGESDFRDLPRDYHPILADRSTLCHRIRYGR